MRALLLLLLLSCVLTHLSRAANCEPAQPMTQLLYSADYATADRICCHNSHYAERSGYLQTVNFFEQLDPSTVTIFYDSVCGIPLFRAPVGRSFAEWEEESTSHGWPSFRSAETLQQNTQVLPNGEILSTCGAHLGHNLPDSAGDRYCINLVCIAGSRKDDHHEL